MIAKTGAELLQICKDNNFSLAEYAIQHEIENKYREWSSLKK